MVDMEAVEARYQEAERLYSRDGLSYRQIARKYRVNRNVVSGWLTRGRARHAKDAVSRAVAVPLKAALYA
jgi:DNA-binding transcriptional regulator LsrR (DeoR family)